MGIYVVLRMYLFEFITLLAKEIFQGSCSTSLMSPSNPRQPVHNNGSSGYGSLGSNGSHEHYISVASSSDSNGNLWEDSHREPVSPEITTCLLWSVNAATKLNYIASLCSCRWLFSKSAQTWTESRIGESRPILIPATKLLFLANPPQVVQTNKWSEVQIKCFLGVLNVNWNYIVVL